MDIICVIPARYNSSRFPGKPLADIHGLPMIKHVWDKCFQYFKESNKIFVATDDERIRNICFKYNINCIMTDSNCLTGTDRVSQVLNFSKADIILNIQGDEPLISPKDIELIVKASKNNEVCCGMCSVSVEDDFFSPNIPKVVTDLNNNLLYISRSPVPANKNMSFVSARKQVCLYSFTRKALIDFRSKKQKTPLEKIEDIEILRFLEMGYKIKMVPVSDSSIAVDTPSDLERVRCAFARSKKI